MRITMPRRLPCVLLLTAVLGGCDPERDEPPAPTPIPATLTGVYSGELPCSNCSGIAATLWLRPDGSFFLRQRFTDDDASANNNDTAGQESARYSLGRWEWDELTAEAVLRGAGPERYLAVRGDDSLQFRATSPIEQVLARDANAAPFTDRLMLDGESAVTEKGATFRECLTGLTFVVAEAGVYNELRRQHRHMNPLGKVALTTIEGHLATLTYKSTPREFLVLDKFITIKPGRGC